MKEFLVKRNKKELINEDKQEKKPKNNKKNRNKLIQVQFQFHNNLLLFLIIFKNNNKRNKGKKFLSKRDWKEINACNLKNTLKLLICLKGVLILIH